MYYYYFFFLINVLLFYIYIPRGRGCCVSVNSTLLDSKDVRVSVGINDT